MTTETIIIVAVVVAAALIALALAWTYSAKRRRERLRSQFGPEYDRAVATAGSEAHAEAVLAEREKRVASYHIRELSAEERGRYAEAWRRVQAQFVDDPPAAVTEADLLVNDVMNTRGYPMSDFDRRAEDLTVGHGHVVHHYREARAIASRHARGEASTEDLRQALVHYRELFAELLHDPKQLRRTA